MNLGIRFASITEVFINPPISQTAEFWWSYFYGLFFFMIVNIVLINILLGVIFDAFGKLRN